MVYYLRFVSSVGGDAVMIRDTEEHRAVRRARTIAELRVSDGMPGHVVVSEPDKHGGRTLLRVLEGGSKAMIMARLLPEKHPLRAAEQGLGC